MEKIDAVVLKETRYIAAWVITLSLLTQAIFLIIGKWDWTVLAGNVLGAAAAIGNFFAMGYAIQLAVSKDEKDAKNTLKLSQTARFFGMFIVAVIGYAAPIFNVIAVVVPLVFPSIGIFLKPLFNKQ